MVFFQAALLAGYGYAHLLTRYAPGRRSVMIHLGLLVVACFWLPLSIAIGWGRPPAVGEAFWLLGLFAVSIGLPFFALAANAPLLQAWFARTDHPAASDPYFLYAASNVGSFLALLSYPILIEPLIPLSAQTWLWAVGFYRPDPADRRLRLSAVAVARQGADGRARDRTTKRRRGSAPELGRCRCAGSASPPCRPGCWSR